jgi:hypothetical protein
MVRTSKCEAWLRCKAFTPEAFGAGNNLARWLRDNIISPLRRSTSATLRFSSFFLRFLRLFAAIKFFSVLTFAALSEIFLPFFLLRSFAVCGY